MQKVTGGYGRIYLIEGDKGLTEKYRMIQKDGLNFVRLYFLNYT